MSKLSSWKAADLAARLSKSGRGKSRPSSGGWLAPCPSHDDGRPSLSLRNTPEGKLLWHCFGGCEAEDVKKALLLVIGGEDAPETSQKQGDQEKTKIDDPWEVVFPVPAEAYPQQEDFHHRSYGSPSRIWTYRLPGGAIGGWIARYDLKEGEKEVIPFTWGRNKDTGREEPRMRAMPPQRPLYNLDRIMADPDAIILLNEGEKAADASEKLFPQWIPTAIPGGSNAVRLVDLSAFEGRTVIILADHDGPGYEFVLKIMQNAPASADLRMIVWPDHWPDSMGAGSYVMKKGNDAADHVASGWTTELLRESVGQGWKLTHGIEFLSEQPFEVIQYVDGRPS